MTGLESGKQTHEQFLNMVYGYGSGAFTINSIVIGDRLGLYRGMKELGRCTSVDLAAHLKLNERWVREWLYQQAAAKVISTNESAKAFWLTKVQEDVLANEHGPDASPCFGIGGMAAIPALGTKLDRLCEAFRSGLGLQYDEYGQEVAKATCRELGVWPRFFLVDRISSIPGLKDKLEQGCLVCDVGCGEGEALRILAAAFPKSTFHGYDTSALALEDARRLTQEQNLTNITYYQPGVHEENMPENPTYDIAITFDAIHDMARPDLVMQKVRQAVKDDGVWIIGDFKVGAPEHNVNSHPFASFLYGFSIHLCMSSALAEEGGLGLGTCGFPKAVADRMLKAAGFSEVEELEWGHELNAYYLVKP